MHAHRRARLGAGVAVLLTAGLATTLGTIPAAHAAPASTASAVRPAAQPDRDGWRLARSVGSAKDVTYMGVPGTFGGTGTAMISSKDAWVMALGGPTHGPDQLSALHWNGHSWRQRLTGGLSRHDAEAIGASSASNAWMFGWRKHNLALHWNGHHWSKRKLPAWATQRLPQVGSYVLWDTVFSKRNAWLFDEVGANGARWNGHRWVKVTMPAPVYDLSAVSSHDLWALGARLEHGVNRWVPMHWNGKSWRTIASPGSAAKGYVGNLTALGKKDVWAVRTPRSRKFKLLHWNGRSWKSASVPKSLDEIASLTGDGHGGLWLGGSTKSRWVLYHRTGGGHWSTWSVHPPTGEKLQELQGVYQLPGTRSVIALGQYLPPNPNGVVGAIWQYRRVS
jgi:hypothetical protein